MSSLWAVLFILALIAIALRLMAMFLHSTTFVDLDASVNKSQPDLEARHDHLDHILDQLDAEERAYLERKLGTGELMLSDDGELVTIEEYKRNKR